MRRQFEESEDELFNGCKNTEGRTKEHFILHQEEIKTNREGKRKREQECHKVGTRGERRGRKSKKKKNRCALGATPVLYGFVK